MNLFILDYDFELNAQYHVNTHVVKMPTEAGQLLGTTYRVTHGEETEVYVLHSDGYRKKKWWLLEDSDETSIQNGKIILHSWKIMGATHINHPCAIWARESLSNFKWIQKYALALNKEWKFRYNHTFNHHAINKIIQTPLPTIEDKGLTPFALATKDIIDADAVTAYRQYYKTYKQHLCAYKNRNIPSFWG